MDRRRHYLDTALALFAAHGYHGVSMDLLVDEAGGSKATLYRYFGSKQELFEALIEDLTRSTVTERPAAELADLSLEEALRAIGHATARGALGREATVLFRLAVGEVTRFPELAAVMFAQGPAVSYARLRDLLAERAAVGEIEVDDLQVAAEQFLGGIVGHQQLRVALGQEPPDPGAIAVRVEAAIRTFLAAYDRRATRRSHKGAATASPSKPS